jgi:ABC-2 type transport system ATP-binding protein
MISVRDLRKSYGQLVAVDGVSFEVRPHETFGLLGPNGAGKTTTLHLLIGALQPDSGEIHIDGNSDPTRPEVRRSIGIAPQDLAAYEDFTASENLRFFARLYGLRGLTLRDRVDASLKQAGLIDRRNHLVKTFSGGMKRRLHLACALVHEPQVLFLDEPTVGIDPQNRNRLLEDIESLKSQGRTVLLTTHYMEEAERLCDRVAIMDHGRILAIDTVAHIIERFGGGSVVQAHLAGPPADAAALPGKLDGLTLTCETDQPFETVKQLATGGLNIRDLLVERPSLETVFLHLTGRSLRD